MEMDGPSFDRETRICHGMMTGVVHVHHHTVASGCGSVDGNFGTAAGLAGVIETDGCFLTLLYVLSEDGIDRHCSKPGITPSLVACFIPLFECLSFCASTLRADHSPTHSFWASPVLRCWHHRHPLHPSVCDRFSSALYIPSSFHTKFLPAGLKPRLVYPLLAYLYHQRPARPGLTHHVPPLLLPPHPPPHNHPHPRPRRPSPALVRKISPAPRHRPAVLLRSRLPPPPDPHQAQRSPRRQVSRPIQPLRPSRRVRRVPSNLRRRPLRIRTSSEEVWQGRRRRRRGGGAVRQGAVRAPRAGAGRRGGHRPLQGGVDALCRRGARRVSRGELRGRVRGRGDDGGCGVFVDECLTFSFFLLFFFCWRLVGVLVDMKGVLSICGRIGW